MKNLQYYIIFGILVLVAVIAWAFKDKTGFRPKKIEVAYTINKTWELPDDLDEVSGIAWLGSSKIACIQDEDGIIFSYDLNAKKITEKIEFGDAGDYEAIAVKGSDAYIMRSDGVVYQVQDFKSSQRKVSSFNTGFSGKNNMESLTFDSNTNSLLTVPKDKDLNDENVKGIYEISLTSLQVILPPMVKIDLKAPVFKDFAKKKIYKTFTPSDIAVHPKTGELYILDGSRPKLLILDPKGKPKKVYQLDEEDFPQPEGITFSPDGALYISNEANDGAATIIQLSLDQ